MSIKIVSRGKGKSAVAAAAYRAGEKIWNEYDGVTHDYTRKGGVAHTEILLPGNAPKEYADRAVLWNAVELAEKNKNAQLAREIELALPVELSREENIALAREYCQRQFVAAGMCADICLHDKDDGNPHAHILLTMRPFAPDGTWAAKSKKEYLLDTNGERIGLKNGAFKTRKIDTVDWNDQGKAEIWRTAWAEAVNTALERQGVAERIDHRSYERQGVEQIPTVHLGLAAFQMEKRGIVATGRGNMNRAIEVGNRELRQLRARIVKLKEGLTGLLLGADMQATPPANLADVLTSILERAEEKTHRKAIGGSEIFANDIAFLKENGITTLPQLRDMAGRMRNQLADMSASLHKVEQREGVLSRHILHAENYLEHKALSQQYRQIKPRKQAAFYEQNRAALASFEAAERYLRPVMNGNTTLPLKQWKGEAAQLAEKRYHLYLDYYRLKENVQATETIRRCVERAVRSDAPQQSRKRTRGWER